MSTGHGWPLVVRNRTLTAIAVHAGGAPFAEIAILDSIRTLDMLYFEPPDTTSGPLSEDHFRYVTCWWNLDPES